MDPPTTATDASEHLATQIRTIHKIISDHKDDLWKLDIVAKELAALERAIERGIFNE